VTDSLFEGEEAVLHVMGDQIASEKRRNPWTYPVIGIEVQGRRTHRCLFLGESAVFRLLG
jgi:hypothetical protein